MIFLTALITSFYSIRLTFFVLDLCLPELLLWLRVLPLLLLDSFYLVSCVRAPFLPELERLQVPLLMAALLLLSLSRFVLGQAQRNLLQALLQVPLLLCLVPQERVRLAALERFLVRLLFRLIAWAADPDAVEPVLAQTVVFALPSSGTNSV